MARILAISSQVVSGHVGLSAMVPALQRMGHEVLPLPTIILSNHPGSQPATGTRIGTDVSMKMLETLESNGRLAGIDAVVTGYLPSTGHVDVAIDAITRCRRLNPDVVILCDPVIGDDPKGAYIDADAAAAIRDRLLPLAMVATPNRFELAWLSSEVVSNTETAVIAARKLGRDVVIATSIPATGDRLATVAIRPGDVSEASVPRRATVPNGTGDLLAALFISGYLAAGRNAARALADAVSAVDRVLDASHGRSELNLATDWHVVTKT